MSSNIPKAGAAALSGLALACLMALPTLADDKDKAKPGPLLKGWGQLSDPAKDCEVTSGDGSLSFKIPGSTHDFSAEIQTDTAPRVLRDLKGDFIVQVKVSGAFKPGVISTSQERRPYHGAGLLVMKDKDNYISLHRGSVNIDGEVRHYANFELRKEGQMTISRYEIDIPDEDTYLRLERRGDKVYEATSPDAIHWTSYDPIELEMPESIQFGFLGLSTSEISLAFKFQDLAIFRKAEPERP